MRIEGVVVRPIHLDRHLLVVSDDSHIHRQNAVLCKVLHLVLYLHGCYDITHVLMEHGHPAAAHHYLPMPAHACTSCHSACTSCHSDQGSIAYTLFAHDPQASLQSLPSDTFECRPKRQTQIQRQCMTRYSTAHLMPVHQASSKHVDWLAGHVGNELARSIHGVYISDNKLLLCNKS